MATNTNFKTIILAAIAFLLVEGCGERGPTYNGKTVKRWAQELCAQDPTRRQAARQQLESGGEDAVPILIELTGDRAQRLDVRKTCIQILGQIGPPARASTDVLEQLLNDNDVCYEAAVSLHQVTQGDRNVLPFLATKLNETGSSDRLRVVHALVTVGKHDAAAAQILVKALGDPDENVRRAVMDSLPKIGDLVLPYLAKFVEEETKTELRKAAILTLPQFGEAAFLTLEKLLNADDEGIRLTAVVALGSFGEREIPLLTNKALQDKSSSVRVTAVSTLGSMGKPALRALASILKEGRDKETHDAAVWALARQGKDAVGVVFDVVDHEDKIYSVLARMEGKDFLLAVGEVVINGRTNARVVASKFLSEIGKYAEPCVTSLAQALKDSNVEVRKNAIMSLAHIRPKTPSTIVAVTDALHDSDLAVRFTAALTLARIGPDASSAVPVIRRLIHEKEGSDDVGDRSFKDALTVALRRIQGE